jgi:hypothetical protein
MPGSVTGSLCNGVMRQQSARHIGGGATDYDAQCTAWRLMLTSRMSVLRPGRMHVCAMPSAEPSTLTRQLTAASGTRHRPAE